MPGCITGVNFEFLGRHKHVCFAVIERQLISQRIMTWAMACWCPHVFGTINDKLSTFYITLNFITDLSTVLHGQTRRATW